MKAILLLVGVVGALYISWVGFTRLVLRNDLSPVPGPWLASLTNLYRLIIVRRGESHYRAIELHKKYGKYVRLGPNLVSVSDPVALSSIYGAAKGFSKSDFYQCLDTLLNGKLMRTVFGTQDEVHHRAIRRPVAQYYAMTNLISYEPLADSTTRVFVDALQWRFVKNGEICDLAQWLQWYAFDVIGEMTFSHRLGFLESGSDVGGICATIDGFFAYGGPIGQMPWLDSLIRRNPVFMQKDGASPLVTFAMKHVQKRMGNGDSHKYNDFLSRFIESQEGGLSKPENIPFIASWAVTNVGAGSDTTGITLTALFYYLLKNPASLNKLREEINSTNFAHESSVRWDEARNMRYLEACVKEALRLHPAVGLPLERVVPKEGFSAGQYWFRPGTIVGVNAWVLHRDREVFGEDADHWRPERWMEDDAERLQGMNRASFAFGGGSRTCIGKNISLFEIYKLVPQLLRKFDFQLAEPAKEWEHENFWFVKPKSLNVKLRLRSSLQA